MDNKPTIFSLYAVIVLTLVSVLFSGCIKNTFPLHDETFIKNIGGFTAGGKGVVSIFESGSGNMILFGNCNPATPPDINTYSGLYSSNVCTINKYGNALSDSGFGWVPPSGFDLYYSAYASYAGTDGYYFLYGTVSPAVTHIRHLDKNLRLIYDKYIPFKDSLNGSSPAFAPVKMLPANDGGWVILYGLFDNPNFYCGILETDASFSKIKWNVNFGSRTNPNDMVSTKNGYYISFEINTYASSANLHIGQMELEMIDNSGNTGWYVVPDPNSTDLPLNLFEVNNDSTILFYLDLNNHNNNFGALKAVTYDNIGGAFSTTYDLKENIFNVTDLSNNYSPGAVSMTADKGFVVTGGHYGVNNTNLILVKYDAGLRKQWENNFYSAAGGTTGYGVYPLSNGGYAIAALSFAFGQGKNGGQNILYKTDANGHVK